METKERADFGTVRLDRACESGVVQCNIIVQRELMHKRNDHLGIDLGVGSRERFSGMADVTPPEQLAVTVD